MPVRTSKQSKFFEWGFLGAGALVIIVTRWLLKSQYLFHWDSIQFALAMNEFDVSRHQPHPPGYIIYVWLGRLFSNFTDDPNVALIALGILASVAGLAIIFYLTKSAFSQSAAYIAALLYVFNPLVWFHGLVAEVYVVEMSLVLVFVWLAHRYYRSGRLAELMGMVVTLGVLGGVRQSAEVVMVPLLVFVMWRQRATVGRWVVTVAGLLAINLAWFIPAVALSGGWSQYWLALTTLTQATVVHEYITARWDALINNVASMVTVLKQSFWAGWLVLLAAVIPFVAPESRARYRVDWQQFWFWTLAIAPGVLIMPLILMRNPGYILSVATLLLVVASGAILFVAKVVGQWQANWLRPVGILIAALVLATQVGSFFTLKFSSFYYLSASLDSVRKVDAYADDIMQTLRREFTPEDSVIWMPGDYVFFGVRHFQYYLPEFEIYAFAPPSFVQTSTDTPVWHVRGSEVSEFISTMNIGPDVRYLIQARETFQTQGHQLVLDTQGGHQLIYYDLDDPETVAIFANDSRFNIRRGSDE